jgi:hypothetical protein
MGNPPANQTTNTGNSGAACPAGTAKFDEALKQESLCPPGLGRPPHVAGMPPRYDPPCTYLRNPSQPSKPADLQVHRDRFEQTHRFEIVVDGVSLGGTLVIE